MKTSSHFLLSLLKRMVGSVLIILLLPALCYTAALVYRMAGSPIIVAEESSRTNWIKRLRFRQTGNHTIDKFLRESTLANLPSLWHVVRGDIRLKDAIQR